MLNRVRDWKVQIMQTVLPLLLIPLVLILDVPQIITKALSDANVEVKDLNIVWRIAIGLGKWPLIIIALFFIYRAIYRHNKDEILKQNIPNTIVWHSFPGYWFCRYILNYQTISLVRVPIPVQFELVWKNIFKKYDCLENLADNIEVDNISVKIFNSKPYTSTVNLILVDTYPLDDWKTKIPASATTLTTIIIKRNGKRGIRSYSKDFVSKIATTMHELPATVTKINVFATVNAAHVYHIVNEVFKTGGRDRIKRVRVYQQTSETWVFEGKKYKEIKIGG